MSFNKKTLGFVESRVNAIGRITEGIRLQRWKRFASFLRWTLLWPYFVVLGFFVWLYSFFKTPDSKRLSVWFLKHYLRFFLRAKNMDWYTVFDIGPLEPSTIIFTTRTPGYGFPLILQLFSDTVIVPMPTWMHKLRMVPFIFYLKLSRYLPLCSYPDQELPSALPNIQALLKAGYPVVVPINPHFSSTLLDHTLKLYKQTFELMNLPYPAYFLSVDGTDTTEAASAEFPTLISIKFKEKSEVLAGTDPTKPESLLRISEFFGFRYLTTL